jgi:hypothetical protein
MPSSASISGQLSEFFWSDPLIGVVTAAALLGLATTPIAFVIFSRQQWFQARRGRVLRRPEFWSVVCSMFLVMGVPAILLGFIIKSRNFDKDRYEFDPNHTLSVLDYGGQYHKLKDADEAVRAERKRLKDIDKNLLNAVKALDDAMLPLRVAALQAPGTAQALPDVLDQLAVIHKAVGLDAPQQEIDLTAVPTAVAYAPAPGTVAQPVAVAAIPAAQPVAPAAANGLSPTEIAVEMASVPAPQKPIAAMLPLTDIPAGWVVGKEMGPNRKSRLETFNADNLYDKIDGRAESFVQYNVQGMAYTFYHAADDESTEAQLYIFDMHDPLKALGKYGSERPEGAKAIKLGDDAYTEAGSVFLHAGQYYTQVVTTKDDPKVAAFAMEIAKRVAALQKPEGASIAESAPAKGEATPDMLFKLLPAEPKKSRTQYVAQDVFGYSFLSDVFMADYQDGEDSFQGFLRPYETADEAKKVFDEYLENAKADMATIKEISDSSADKMVLSSNYGMNDAIFLKGNAIAGVNGSPDAAKAESFARDLAKSLPPEVPTITIEKTEKSTDANESP